MFISSPSRGSSTQRRSLQVEFLPSHSSTQDNEIAGSLAKSFSSLRGLRLPPESTGLIFVHCLEPIFNTMWLKSMEK